MIAQIRLLRREGWSEYRDAVGPLAARFGGRYIVAGGAKVEVLEGAHDGRSLVVFEFPDVTAIDAFWRSAEYAALKALRAGLAELDVWAVPGVTVPSTEDTR